MLTSFLVTGLSRRTRCVKRGNVARGSKSASSLRLLDSSWRFVRFGIELASVGCMVATRLRARRRVCIRGDSGKLPRTWMSLSTKSMASWGYMAVKEMRYESGQQFSSMSGKQKQIIDTLVVAIHSLFASRAKEKKRENDKEKGKEEEEGKKAHTPATPRFSMAGMRCPIQCPTKASLSTLLVFNRV